MRRAHVDRRGWAALGLVPALTALGAPGAAFAAQPAAPPAITQPQAPVTQPPAAAQPAGPTLTVADAVQQALARNPQIAAARASLTAAQQNIVQARLGLSPTVSATGSGSVGTIVQTTTGQAIQQSGTTTTGSASITGTLPIWDGGKTRVAVEQAEAAQALAQAALRQTEQDVALQAATQVFAVLKAERLADVRQALLAQAQTQLNQAQARFQAGVAAQADVIQAQAQVAQAQVDLLSARAQIATSKVALQSTIAADVTAPVEVQAPPVPPAQVTVSADAVVLAALQKRPEVAAANAGVQAGRAGVDSADVNTGPQLNVDLNGVYTPVSTSSASQGAAGALVTGSVSLPLFDSGRRQAALSAARASLTAAQAKLEQARAAVRQDAYQAYLSAVQAAANVGATLAARQAADEALRVSTGRYQAGVATITEVITAQAQAAQARVNAASAEYDFETALATLNHAQGVAILTGLTGGGA